MAKQKSSEKKYQTLIKKGVIHPLLNIPFHHKAPLKRLLMQDAKTFPDLEFSANYRIVAHIINKLPKRIPEYVDMHAHNCDEINLILSQNGKLVYEVFFEDEKYTVSSPATVYIPKGVRHKAQVRKGQGIFVCIIMTNSYWSSLILPSKKQ